MPGRAVTIPWMKQASNAYVDQLRFITEVQLDILKKKH